MLEISISRELAAAHPGFIAGCAERGHRVEVFGDATEPSERCGSEGMTEETGEAAGRAVPGGVSGQVDR